MKRIMIACLMIACIVSMFAAQKTISFANAHSGVSIVNERSSGIVLDWSINQLNLDQVAQENQNFTRLTANGFVATSEVGLPELPFNGKIIAVPVNAVLSVNFVNTHSTIVDLKANGFNHPVYPAQASVEKCENPKNVAFEMNSSAYQQESYRNIVPVTIEEIGFMRGYRLVLVAYTPIEYNPVKNTMKVYDQVRVEISFDGADMAETEYLRAKYYSPAFDASMAKSVINFAAPNTRDTLTRYPMKYVIISDPMFQAQLAPFIEWKTMQGFHVIVKYKGEAEIGSTKETIKAYMQSLWNAATPTDPAPTYLLIVGDHAQIPAWNAQSSPSGHITDLTYVRLQGTDFLPELYYGRFSANNVNELQPQIDKTLYYEKYQFADPTYLNKQILIAGVDSNFGYTHANGQINYITTHYANATNGIEPFIHLYPGSGSQDAQIVSETSGGVGWINYTAHGDWNSWSDPTFTIANINSLQNANEYSFVIGNCCLTNKFENTTCFGEAWLRAVDKGAIIYIGGTNSTYWNEDYHFACGFKTPQQTAQAYNPNTLGMYDQAYHTHGELYENWNVSAMGMVHAGNMVVQSTSSDKKNYYWEIYSVMGDPSLVPYLKQGVPNQAQYANTLFIGMDTYTITGAAPYSFAALSFEGELKGTALCDENGDAVITLDPITTPGNAKLVISAQNHIPVIADIQVIPNEGAYIVYQNVNVALTGNSSIDYDSNSPISITLNNVGSESAQNLTAIVRSLNPYITVNDSTETIASISANGTVTLQDAFSIISSENCPDALNAQMELIISDQNSNVWTSTFRITLNAPVITMGTMQINDTNGNNNGRLDPGETILLTVPFQNTGHAPSANGVISYASVNPLVTISNNNFNMNALSVNETSNLVLTITASPDAPTGTTANIGIFAQFGQIVNQTSFVLPVGLKIESFETGDFSAYPWTNTSASPWTVVNTGAFDGTYTAKSGAIGNSANTFITVTDTATTAGVIKFALKVSSETNYDFLKFYVDNVEKGSWSGTVDWTEVEYPVTAGAHTYKWTYSKDSSQIAGSDCAWVDKIIFPASGGTAVNAPIAYVNNQTIDFGSIQINNTLTKSFNLVNFGNVPLTGTITVSNPFFIDNPETQTIDYSIPANSYQSFNVTFAPLTDGPYNSQITITSNDTTQPTISIDMTAVALPLSNEQNLLPKVSKLNGNYPNPFNPTTKISYSLKEGSQVNIQIFNIKGQLVKQLVNGLMPAGNHTITWNGNDENQNQVSSGVYFYRMQSKEYSGTRKMLLMK